MATVTLENVSSTGSGGNAGRAAQHNLNIDIPDNTFFVFLGPTGSGKSRILRLIAGLDSPPSGNILIGGKDVKHLPPKDREVALIFPGDTLIPHLTVKDNVCVGLHGRKLAAAESGRRVESAAALLKIESILNLKPAALTPAQRIRVSISRAVVRQPKVFLLDEPLSGLGAADRDELRPELLKLFQHLQATVIHVTRNPGEAIALGTAMAVLNEGGRIEQTGAPSAIYREPANRFVAGFTSVPPMNFLEGSLRKDGEAAVFKEAPGGTLEVRLSASPAHAEWIGKPVTLGLRPEDIDVLPTDKTPSENTFQVLADVVEAFGPETFVHAETGAHKLLVRSIRSAAAEGTGHRVRLRINASRARLFDSTNGCAIG